MIKRIVEYNNIDIVGEDIIDFYVFLQDKEGKEIKIPLIISFWNLRKFLGKFDSAAADYISKVSSGIRSYGSVDSKILQILHSDGFPVHSFVQKYVNDFSEEDIQKHIEWSENLVVDAGFSEKMNKLRPLLPDLASNNSRRNIFAAALDEAIQKEIRKFYPEFFDKVDRQSYSDYDDVLMTGVNNLVTKLNDFFYKESQKRGED